MMHPLFYFRSFNVSTRERINEVALDNQYNILILYQLPITIRESIEVILCLARTWSYNYLLQQQHFAVGK